MRGHWRLCMPLRARSYLWLLRLVGRHEVEQQAGQVVADTPRAGKVTDSMRVVNHGHPRIKAA